MNTQRRQQIYSRFHLSIECFNHAADRAFLAACTNDTWLRYDVIKNRNGKKARMLILDSDTSLWWSLWYCAHVSCNSKNVDKNEAPNEKKKYERRKKTLINVWWSKHSICNERNRIEKKHTHKIRKLFTPLSWWKCSLLAGFYVCEIHLPINATLPLIATYASSIKRFTDLEKCTWHFSNVRWQ